MFLAHFSTCETAKVMFSFGNCNLGEVVVKSEDKLEVKKRNGCENEFVVGACEENPGTGKL